MSTEKEKILKELSHLSEDELILIKKMIHQRKEEKKLKQKKSGPGYLKTREALKNIILSDTISENRNERT